MRRTVAAIYVGCVFAGLGLGVIEAAKWLHALSLPQSAWNPVFEAIRTYVWLPATLITIGIGISAYTVAAIFVPSRPRAAFIRTILASAIALLLCWVVIKLSATFYLAPPVYIPGFAAALAISATLLFYVFTPPHARSVRTSAIRGLEISVGWALLVILLRIALDSAGRLSFGGLSTFALLSYPPELRAHPDLLKDLAGGIICGAVVGALAAKLAAGRRMVCGALWGGAAGAWISSVLYLAHSVAGSVIMQSGYSERVACCASFLLLPAAGLVIALGTSVFLPGSIRNAARVLCASSLALLLLAGGWYVADSRSGSDLYIAAVKTPRYLTRAYIHFHSDGGWTRTSEQHADELVIGLCDRLINGHPRCVYRAHAMYLKARCQFALWRFSEAAATLEQLRNDYPGSHGSASLLLAHAYLAEGRFEAFMKHLNSPDPIFEQWRSGDGQLMLGRAYEVMGDQVSAFNNYKYYTLGLASKKSGAWVASAARFAERRTDRVTELKDVPIQRASVHGRVVLDGQPLSGVRIALIQPHIDASSPDNSRQFTGAITVPLWFGHGAITDNRGRFAVSGVPYGEYEVVVGFDIARTPDNRVISHAVTPVSVADPDVMMPTIEFVQAVELLSPVDGRTVNRTPTLTWRAYPGADHYAVSVISKSNLDLQREGDAASAGYQFWSRSNIKGTSVDVSPDGFASVGDTQEACELGILPDRYYTWIVIAYDKMGNIISTSEKYRLSQEPLFLVQSGGSKGG